MGSRFSILTTAYRAEMYLESSINSVRSQTMTNWELIVVDNGMSDAIADIVTRYARADSRVRLVRQENRGYAGGINAAARHASGDFLCLLDSDDQLLPKFCATVDARLSSDPDLDAVCVDVRRFRNNDEFDIVGGYRTLPSRKVQLRVVDVLSGRVPYSGAIRREAWTDIGGLDSSTNIEADILLWGRLAAAYRVGIIHEKLARVREHDDSESRSREKIEGFQSRMIQSYEMLSNTFPGTEHAAAAAKTIRQLRYHLALHGAREAFSSGDLSTSRSEAAQALRQGRTVRALLVCIVLRIPRRPLRYVYQVKSATHSRFLKFTGRLDTWLRSRASSRDKETT